MKSALVGLGIAVPGFAFAFRSHRLNFWARMTLVAGTLGLIGLLDRSEPRPPRPTISDALIGASTAIGLYGIFQIGDRAARRIMPSGTQDIQNIYQLRTVWPRWLIAALLIGIVAPGEELFWRHSLQGTLMRRFGTTKGTLAGAVAYGAVHLSSGNLTLTGAAATAGAFWGLQYALRRRLSSNVVSHILWDVWIFLIAPTPGAKDE